VHGFLEFLRKDWINLAVYLMVGVNVARINALRRRERRCSLLEADAERWPTVDGIATCRVLPVGLSRGYRLFVGAEPADGGRRAEWTRVFPLKKEADYYARALRGRTVAVHVEPYGDEKILCWDELKSAVPPFISETQGRLTPGGYAGAQVFRAVAWGGLGLATVDVATFVRNPDFMWYGMCLCGLSLALLGLGCLLLAPASMLRFRVLNLQEANTHGHFERVMRSILLFLVGAAVLVWVGVLSVHGLSKDSPDWMSFAMLSAPMFPLFWWSSVIAAAAVRELRPIAPVVEAARVDSGAVLVGTTDTVQG